jgi:hypothetical protein
VPEVAMAKPVTMLVSYYPKSGREAELQALVEQHYPTLSSLGLVTDQRAQVWKAFAKDSGRPHFVELFQWKTEQSSDVAHQTPELMAIWETMGPILERLDLVELQQL